MNYECEKPARSTSKGFCTRPLGHWATGPLPSSGTRPLGHFRMGFNMLEILISMAIFAIGFVAVSAIFPAAIYLQKQTTDAVQAEAIERNIEALLKARKLPLATVQTLANASPLGDIQPWSVGASSMIDSTTPDNDIWRFLDRSFPSNQPDPTKRRYVWVPLFRNISGVSNNLAPANQWELYVFLLQTESKAENNQGQSMFERLGSITYANRMDGWFDFNDDDVVDNTNTDFYSVPGVFAAPGGAAGSTFTFSTANYNPNSKYLRPGDMVLDNLGVIYTIASVDTAANTVTVQGSFNNASNVRALWLAQPSSPTATSPLMKIMILPNSGREYIQ